MLSQYIDEAVAQAMEAARKRYNDTVSYSDCFTRAFHDDWGGVQQLLEQHKALNAQQDPCTHADAYLSAALGYATNGDFLAAVRLLAQMPKEVLSPVNLVSKRMLEIYLALLRAGRLDALEKIHSLMDLDEPTSTLPPASFFPLVEANLHILRARGQMDAYEQLLALMPERRKGQFMEGLAQRKERESYISFFHSHRLFSVGGRMAERYRLVWDKQELTKAKSESAITPLDQINRGMDALLRELTLSRHSAQSSEKGRANPRRGMSSDKDQVTLITYGLLELEERYPIPAAVVFKQRHEFLTKIQPRMVGVLRLIGVCSAKHLRYYASTLSALLKATR